MPRRLRNKRPLLLKSLCVSAFNFVTWGMGGLVVTSGVVGDGCFFRKHRGMVSRFVFVKLGERSYAVIFFAVCSLDLSSGVFVCRDNTVAPAAFHRFCEYCLGEGLSILEATSVHRPSCVPCLRPAVGHVTFQKELWQFKVFRMFLLDLSLVPVENVQDVHRTRGIRARRCARRENPPEKRARRLWIIRK